MWTLSSALNFLRSMEVDLAPEWHCALAGGVLHHGESFHDLDVIVFPHDSTKSNLSVLTKSLERSGLTRRVTAPEMHQFWRDKHLTDEKHVEVWKALDGSRVDILVLK